MSQNETLQAKLEGHEKLDNEIHTGLKTRLVRIEYGILTVLLTLISGLYTIIHQLAAAKFTTPLAAILETLR